MSDWVFLDNHTKAPPSTKLIEEAARSAKEHWLVAPWQKAQKEMEEILGAKGYHIGFSTEPHFAVLFHHYMEFIRKTGRTHILALANERPEILKGIKRLEKFEVQGKILEPNEKGHLTAASLEEVIRPRSSLLSLSWAHLRSGVIQPLHDLAAICKKLEIRLHVDLSAAAGKLFFQLYEFDADFYTIDGSLLGLPFPGSLILSKEQISPAPRSILSVLNVAIREAFDPIDHYSLEIGRLRNLFEAKLEKLGGIISHQEAERLPNTTEVVFPGIYGEQIANLLQKKGVFARGETSLSFALSNQTSQKDLDRASAAMEEVLGEIQKKKTRFTDEDAKAKGMRLCKGVVEGSYTIQLTILVDEEDGVIADAAAEVFGPSYLLAAAERVAEILLRKNTLQARRLTASLIEKELSSPISDRELNLLIDAIDRATEPCLDIPIEDIYIAPPEMGEGERTEYPGWENLNDELRKKVIAEVLDKEVRPYVELDAGGVEVQKVEANRVTIAYSGNCTSCFSATGATLDAIGNILRHRIYPDLMVVPDTSLLQI